MPPRPSSLELAEALENLDRDLSGSLEKLGKSDPAVDDWLASIRKRILPRLRGETPLVVGLCGGGNAGKSTLFNALVGRAASSVGPRAGLTRRALLAIPRAMFAERRDLLGELFQPFGGIPEPLPEDDGDAALREPGPPLYVLADEGLPGAILVDMPDMDVAGKEGGYANRANASKVLAACDVLILIAGNATYNNRDIAKFMRETASENGLRGSILVYRFPNPFSEPDHLEHAFETMARHLYPDEDDPPVLERLVMADDPAVREGEPPLLVPLAEILSGERPDAGAGLDALRRVVSGLDRLALDFADTAANIEKGLAHAVETSNSLAEELRRVREFRKAVEFMTVHTAQSAFSAFPMDEFYRVASEIWKDQQNIVLKFGRALGDAVRSPFHLVRKAVEGFRGGPSEKEGSVAAEKNIAHFLRQTAALYDQLQEKRLFVPRAAEKGASGGADAAPAVDIDDILPKTEIPMPEQYGECLEAISGDGYFREAARSLRDVWDEAIRLPPDVDAILTPVIREARKNMSLRQVAKEVAVCSADVILPAVAVGYVVMTGDVASGAALGFLEVTDIAAVAAIPVLTGNEALDRRWIRAGLAKVVAFWQETRTPKLEEAIRDAITGPFLTRGDDLLRRTESPVERIGASIADLGRKFGKWKEEATRV